MNKLPFTIRDILRVKWQLAFTICAVVFSIFFALTVDDLDTRSGNTLSANQKRLNNARQSVDQIEEEENTIIEYIDRYQEMEAEGIVESIDKVQFMENFQEVRTRHNLFPISLKVDDQLGMRLDYPDDGTETGDPVDLLFSPVEFSLPLLHEGDMFRLLTDLLASPGLFQIRQCSVKINDPNTSDFFYLSRHFTGNCKMYWYTFDLEPEEGK